MRPTSVLWLAAVAAVVLSSTVTAQQQQQLPAGLEDYVKQQLEQAISQDVAQEVARAVAERVALEQRNRLYGTTSPPPTSLTPTTTAPTSSNSQPVLGSPAPAGATQIQGELRAIAQERAELQREQETLNKERIALNEVIVQLQNQSTAPATIAPVATNTSAPVTVSVASTADGITTDDDAGAPWGIIGVCVGLVAAVALVVVGVKKRNAMSDGLETPAEYASGFHTAEAASARESKWDSYEVVTPLDMAGVPPEDPILDDTTDATADVEAPTQLNVRGREAVL
ncbi:hypothetical protein SPRG_16713 [Saprolegnia parasitica CBS 223.65]|uniref:RxLR effector protein n=1 Tax=Saprolegnia parasitica (strain CBS 223.65) TaxID=695850 RepID=A0A067BT93_SAPPC|nr:hypothetical protein SPRG_16713 [Saprolegnia parasitica CBS 223.65]KDO17867.1 hypothetical protein SPRG_16713 [Saprolegnia parasitica CBS 223.65]|eukprot:XP_012211418.1 hypothetical protein SPRG_16713 [Saprolegnia parasitica CBS 223.65]